MGLDGTEVSVEFLATNFRMDGISEPKKIQ
jgi:hypothetical protein